ncbi:MAG TPA: bilirubin oxidase, partial [Bacteroidetes bacterium]|nr:bilirubin oxidase [Bacteroidota bacterium]
MNRTILILFLLFTQQVMGQNALLIPDTLSGTSINLTLQTGSHQFYSGQNTATYGANGNILGPTLLLNQGDFVSFSVNNQLADTTTIHWHGLHVSSENDGGPHTIIAPNTTWSPSFTILDKAATYWYHPHLHSKTNEHVSKGIAGQIWVRDSAEASLNLPRTYGVDDFPLVLQTKDFDSNNEIVVHSNSDNVPMVNATLDPFLQVPAQVIRYRILNGSSQRTFNLGLSNGQSFSQIASDGGLLSLPFNTNRLRLAPGERAEILINFSGMNGQSIFLKSFASELPNGIYGATYPGMGQGMVMNGYNPNPLNGSDFDLLKFDVVAPNANPVTAI